MRQGKIAEKKLPKGKIAENFRCVVEGLEFQRTRRFFSPANDFLEIPLLDGAARDRKQKLIFFCF